MSPRAPRVTAKEIKKALERAGWKVVQQTGSHIQLKHDGKSGRVTIAMHAGETIQPGLLNKILKQADMTMEELRGLL